MQVFGDIRHSFHCPRVATPVGQACAWCAEILVDGDAGFLLPLLTAQGVVQQPFHLDCFHRQASGSLAHQRRLCSCYGVSESVERAVSEGMSRREEARQAARLMRNVIYRHAGMPQE